MCGRPRKWFTEEERIKAINASARRYVLNTSIANDDGEASYKAKHKFYRYPGVTVSIETFDKFYISTICISYVIGIKWIDDIDRLDVFEPVCNKYMQNWLEQQTEWSPKYHIFVWDRPIEHNNGYIGKRRYVKGQHHLKRITPPIPWYDTKKELEGVIDEMVEQIKKTCDETGLELYVKEKLSDDFTNSTA